MNNTMVNNMKVVNELNKVEGFDPRPFLRNLAVEGEPEQPYLDVVYRKLWFRLKNPEGKIVSKILQLTDHVAVFEAKVYLDRHDPEECFIASAIGQRFYKPDDPIGEKYAELAETASIGRALQLAGYGLQFPEQTKDPAIVDAPMSTGQLSDCSGYTSNVQPQWDTQNGSTAPVIKPEEKPAVIDATLPVETIYNMLDYKTAESVVCSFGAHRGKTMKMIAIEKPESLVWIRDKYCGNDNLVKAAATFLIDMALQQAG